MKHFLINLKLQILVWLLITMFSLSLVETSNCTKLPTKYQATSVQFKLLNGSNRIAETNQLLKAISENEQLSTEEYINTSTNTLAINNIYTFKDLEKIFGNPSIKNQDGSYTNIYDYTNNKYFTIVYKKTENNIQIVNNN